MNEYSFNSRLPSLSKKPCTTFDISLFCQEVYLYAPTRNPSELRRRYSRISELQLSISSETVSASFLGLEVFLDRRTVSAVVRVTFVLPLAFLLYSISFIIKHCISLFPTIFHPSSCRHLKFTISHNSYLHNSPASLTSPYVTPWPSSPYSSPPPPAPAHHDSHPPNAHNSAPDKIAQLAS